MRIRVAAIAAGLLACANALHAAPMIGVTFSGDVFQIDSDTGTTRLIGPSGFTRLNSLTLTDGALLTVGGLPGDGQDLRLIEIDPATGRGTQLAQLAGGINVRGIAFSPPHGLVTVEENVFARYDPTRFQRQDVLVAPSPMLAQGMDFSPAGQLYAFDVHTRGLFTIDLSTMAITTIGPTAPEDFTNVQSIAFAPDGRLFGVGEGNAAPLNDFLALIDPTTGARTIITDNLQGIDNVRGIVVLPEPATLVLFAGAVLALTRRPARLGPALDPLIDEPPRAL